MTALRPHTLHPPSLKILLGLEPPPNVPGTEDTRSEENKDRPYSYKNANPNLGGRYKPEDVKRFCEAVEEKLKEGIILKRQEIIQSLKEDETRLGIEILPRCIKNGRIPSANYMYGLIHFVRKDLEIYAPTRTEQIVFLALSGKDRKQVREELRCSTSMVADAFNALGFNSKKRKDGRGYMIDTSVRIACQKAKEKFFKMKQKKENEIS